ncbi:MAG: hypothetical protein E5W03_11560 [Mesorhizobium sp.]|nr:MAG: hypothetical protein E5W03_11560 [Mesorhizobium sp.]TIV09035.1 MAG: hypothetical protein E5W02_22180 [Mesorhizobium sp.]
MRRMFMMPPYVQGDMLIVLAARPRMSVGDLEKLVEDTSISIDAVAARHGHPVALLVERRRLACEAYK